MTTSVTPAGTRTLNYDIGGNVVLQNSNNLSTTVTVNSTTNYAAPSAMTTNSLSSSMSWTSFLGLSSATGPNGDSGSTGNTVTVTDPALKYKTFTMDALGNLTQVQEPDPGGGQQSNPSASFVKLDTTTQGSWKGVYGADGYNVIGDQSLNPSYVVPSPSGQSLATWASSTSDVRALQKASNPADRIAATWYTYSSFTVDLNVTDGNTHQVAVYCLDWDTTARQQTVDVADSEV